MFATSPRPVKRQRTSKQSMDEPIDRLTTPRTPRNTKKDDTQILTTSAKRNGRATRSQALNEGRQDVTSNSDFVDSAYHSMGASPDNTTNENSNHETSSPRTKRHHARNATDDCIGLSTKESQARLSVQKTARDEHNNEDESDEDGSVIVVRASGRARTKTWKSAELDQDTQKNLTPSKTISGRKRKISTPQQTAAGSKSASLSLERDSKESPAASANKTKSRSQQTKKQPALLAESGESIRKSEVTSTPTKGKVPQAASRLDEITTPGKSKDKKATSHNRSVSDAITPARTITKPARHKGATLSSLIEDDENRDVLVAIRDQVVKNITSSGPIPLYGEGHSIAYQKVYQVLEQTVSAGEGNSMLLIGARGTAKTGIIDLALQELNHEFNDQFHTIRLNGFLHTDDKLALKEIWRQLGKEMAVEDNSMSDRGNYADTLASLLALLSQPEELISSEEKRTTSKAVVFILDEFDLFTTHPRQTLLYNLFDIAQSRKAPIAVLGLTTRIDVVESLEKRVKSRFSHRYVHLSHPKSFSAYISITRTFLLASAYENEEESRFTKSSALESLSIQHSRTFRQVYEAWSAYVNDLLVDPSVQLMASRYYDHTKSPQAFLNAIVLSIMSMPQTLPQPADIIVNNLSPADSNLHLLSSLSDASLALLIAAARLDIVCDTDTVTFNMAYDEYTRLAQRSRLVASAGGQIAVSGSNSGSKGVLGRDVALAAWEQLEEIGLLLPVAGQGGYSQAQGMVDLGRGGRLVRVDVGLEEIGAIPGVDLGAMLKWCKEI